MESIKSNKKVVFLLFVVLLTSLLTFIPQAFAKSSNASYDYEQVNVTANCISNDEIDITVDIRADLDNVLCWWVNYGGNTNIETELQSCEIGTSQNSLKSLELIDNGSQYQSSGTPPSGKCAYDKKNLMLYINPGETHRYSGTLYIRYKTKLTNAAATMWSGNTFSLTPFTTNGSSNVPELNVTIENADRLSGSGIVDYQSYVGGLFVLPSNKIDLQSSDGKTLVFTGALGAWNNSSNIFISSTNISVFSKIHHFLVGQPTTVFVALIIIAIITRMLLFHILGKRQPKELRGVYFRDVPKSDNPINAAYRALTYRNPNSHIKEVISEENLISYILLKNKDEGLTQLSEDTIKVKTNELNSEDRKVYEKFTLKKLCNIFNAENHVLDTDGEGYSTFTVDEIKETGKALDKKVKHMNNSYLKTFSREIGEYKADRLINLYVDRNQKTATVMKNKRKRGVGVDVDIHLSMKDIGVIILGLIMFAGFVLTMFAYGGVVDQKFIYMGDLSVIILTAKYILGYHKEMHETYDGNEMETTKQVIGLKNWILDFTSIKEQPPEADIVWGDFIKWAYLLGVQEKAMEIARGVANSKVADSIAREIEMITQTTSNIASCALVANSISNSVANSVSSSVSSASSSSGGSSGGGGGGGGGCR